MRPTRKINHQEALDMEARCITRKEQAAHFGCSEVAISKFHKKHRPVHRPEILDKLTDKEERFAFARAEGKSQTDAVMEVYEVTTRASARSIGSELSKNPDVQEAISTIMETEGLTRRKLVRRLSDHVDSLDPAASLRAVDMSLRLRDEYPASKSVHINIEAFAPVDLSRYRNKI